MGHLLKPVEDMLGVGITGTVLGCVIQIESDQLIMISETNYVPIALERWHSCRKSSLGLSAQEGMARQTILATCPSAECTEIATKITEILLF